MATGAVIEEVATNLEEVAEVTRTVNAAVVGAFLGGTGFGGILGAIWGYRFGQRRTKAEAMREAEQEIAEMREHFHQKEVARQNEDEKKHVETIVEEDGYVVTERARPLRPPVPVMEPTPIVKAMNDVVEDGWHYGDEFSKRRPGIPYVIHEDEFTNDNLPLYNVTAYNYYGVDAVLADEDGSKIADVEGTVGNALNRFGHGSSDPNTVFVRNDKLQLQIEIQRLSDRSYEQDVEGLQHDKE